MKNFLIGAQLYSVRSLTQTAEGLDDTFQKIKRMGYNTVQLSGQNREIPDEHVKALLDKHALKCVVTHNSMDEFEQQLDALIKRHKLWDCKFAGVGSMPGKYHEDAQGFKAFAQRANDIAERLAGEGLTFVYHNHAFEFSRFGGALGMDILFDNFGEHTQFELDSYWIQAGGCDPVEWFYKVNGRMQVAHFKDMAGTINFNPHCTMAPVGSGNLNWKALIRACEETGVLYAEVEQDNASDMPDPLGQMRESCENLKKLGCAF